MGQRFIAAVAQIVYTATDLDGIEAVSFRVEGEDFPVNDENGAAQDEPVDRSRLRRPRPLLTDAQSENRSARSRRRSLPVAVWGRSSRTKTAFGHL